MAPSADELRAACVDEGSSGKVPELFQSLIQDVLSPDASQEAAKECILQVKDVLQENKNNICNVLVDVIWLETSSLLDVVVVEKTVYPEPLIDLLKSLMEAVPDLQAPLLETLDASLLQTAGIVASESDLQKKIRLTNTQQYYRQHKFNLMVEESEGFAKLLHTILHLINNAQAAKDDDGVAVLLGVIGTFSLDPNRCLDLLLDILEQELEADKSSNNKRSTTNNKQPQQPPHNVDANPKLQRILTLMKGLSLDKLPALLAFKLGREGGGAATAAVDRVLHTSAFLVLHKVLDLAEFLTFLPEWEKDLQFTHDAVKKQEREAVRALGRVRLSSSSSKQEEKKEVDRSPVQNHPTTKLVLILLEWNQFSAMEKLFEPYWSMLCFLFPETIGSFLCNDILEHLDPIYNQVLREKQVVPWATADTSGEGEEKTMEEEESSSDSPLQDRLLSVVDQKLEYTKASGCIVLHPILYCKICRLLASILKTEKPSAACTTFLSSFLIPSLSQFHSRPSLSQEMWKILEHFPYETRYSLYSSWRGTGLERDALLSTKPLWLIQGEILAGKEARHALKRLSKDTIRDACRAIAKVCHSHPLVVFSTILSQIESYDNLVQVMVDALRFVTPLSLDVLGFCVLGRLSGTAGGANRSRLKDDGVNVSQWLQSLESFIGALYKHFPSLELGGIMTYLMSRVSTGHVLELGVLRTLLKESGGWAFADYAPAASLSATQLEGRAGSTLLKRETMSFGVFQKFNKKASASVRRVLLNDEIGVKLLILLSQIPNQIIFDTSSKPPKPVKLIGALVDTSQVTTAILLGFLTDKESGDTEGSQHISRFAMSLPALASLHSEYELDVASAWMLARPLIRAATSGRIAEGAAHDKWTPSSMKTCFESMLPEKFWAHVSQSVFEVFYSNNLYDICCPGDIYKAEIDRLEKEEERLKQPSSFTQTATGPARPDAADSANEAERVKKTAALLTADLNEQKKHVGTTREAIASAAKDFFVPDKSMDEAATLFFCHCIYPRCMKGPGDALYCARFLLLLHSLEVPGFSTMHLFDILIVASSRSLFGLTEGEAANFSVLLNEIWKTISKWRYDEDAFKSELDGKVGSRMVNTGEDGNEDAAPISQKRFSELYNKWHAAIGSTALGCLHSREYIHNRNALIVLTRIVEVYPTRPRLANKLLADLQPMQDESYPFADIRASAQAYSTQLLKARDDGVWKEESAAEVNARLAKEKAAAAARQKKAEEQMAQIQRDSEKITEEIGEKESWGRVDRDRRAPYRSTSTSQDDRNRGASANAPADSRGTHSTPSKERRDGNAGPARDNEGGAWRDRDRTGTGGRSDPHSAASVSSPTSVRRDAGAGDSSRRGALEGRWQKAPPADSSSGGRGGKRSRPPSPADPGEIQEDASRNNKRQRAHEDSDRQGDDGRKYRSKRRNR